METMDGIKLKETSERTVQREVYEFGEELGYWNASTWTRVTVNGELSKWVPHDAYGEMMDSDSARSETSKKLEQLYQNSDYA